MAEEIKNKSEFNYNERKRCFDGKMIKWRLEIPSTMRFALRTICVNCVVIH